MIFIVGTVLGSIATLSGKTILIPYWAWFAIGIVALFIAQFLAFHKARKERDDLRKKFDSLAEAQPNLVLHHIEHPVTNINKMAIDAQGKTKIIGNPHFTRIWISNEPKSPSLGVDAENVHAEIQFRDESQQKVELTIEGRWSEAGQPASSLITQQMTIPPNRKPFCLDVLMKYLDDDDMYAYDDLAHQIQDGRNPNTRLGKGKHFVRIILACKGVFLPLWFEVDNWGKGYDIYFLPNTIKQIV